MTNKKAWRALYKQIKAALPYGTTLEHSLSTLLSASNDGKLPQSVAVAAYGVLYAIEGQRADVAIARRLHAMNRTELARTLARAAQECQIIAYVPRWLNNNIGGVGEEVFRPAPLER